MLTGHVASQAQRWHFTLDSGEIVSLLVNDSDEPWQVLARFDEVLACRLAAELAFGLP